MSNDYTACPFCGGEAHVTDDYSGERGQMLCCVWHMCPEGGDAHHYGEGTGRVSIETAWFFERGDAMAAWNERCVPNCKEYERAEVAR